MSLHREDAARVLAERREAWERLFDVLAVRAAERGFPDAETDALIVLAAKLGRDPAAVLDEALALLPKAPGRARRALSSISGNEAA